MEDDKTFELMTKMYGEMQNGFKEVNKKFDAVDKRFDGIDKRLDGMDKRIGRIEVKIDGEIMPKLETLFDGYKQNSERLTRIEDKVSNHEEIIYKRVK
ncbi:MAG: hypothetical protein PHX70_10795 [Clostridium sp.]|nr:hypothetical protein [Clostridium sp.]